MSKKLIVVAGPSGAGKTTIVKSLLKKYPFLTFSISATTRVKRGVEEHGKDYYFLTSEEFERKIREGSFLEFEEVYKGIYYGTLLKEIKRLWKEDKIPVLDIDVKGALKVKHFFQGKALFLFVHPGSPDLLKERLMKRGTDSPQSIAARLERAKEELSYSSRFDHILYNTDLRDTIEKAEGLLEDFLK